MSDAIITVKQRTGEESEIHIHNETFVIEEFFKNLVKPVLKVAGYVNLDSRLNTLVKDLEDDFEKIAE